MMRPQGQTFGFFFSLSGNVFYPFVLLIHMPLLRQHFTLETDERLINVQIFSLSAALFGYYKGTHFMMKPL